MFVLPGCNIAEGRNEAIKRAENELIVSTDFGCRYHKKWLESLVTPFDNPEVKVVETEMKREGFSFWYRNPQQPGQSSLGIAYLSDEQYGIVRPDFIFFSIQADGTVVADIVDPHSLHLADALPKLKGLALYAESHDKVYRRIESVAEAMGKLRVLDLTNANVREAIAAAKDAASLFTGALARDY